MPDPAGGSAWTSSNALWGVGVAVDSSRAFISPARPAETIQVHDPSDDGKVRKDENGVVHLGKLGRETVAVAVL